MKKTAVVLLMLFSMNAFSQFSPVNKNASPEAKKLLAYLYSLDGNQTLTGQHN
jgi:mannan endo-1,4-beta-mannosidase